MDWNFDISAAPRDGSKVLLATKCGKVLPSNWRTHKRGWLMLGDEEAPVAWMPWPAHPHAVETVSDGVQYNFLE